MYGLHGVQIHPEWVIDTEAFAQYLMALPGCYDQTLVLDRIDNDGHYVPGNLRFVTNAENCRNNSHTALHPPLYDEEALHRLLDIRRCRKNEKIGKANRSDECVA